MANTHHPARGWTRRTLLGTVGISIWASSMSQVLAATPSLRAPIVRVREGLVEGAVTATPGVHRWLGMPYARPPVGALRWRAPQPALPWAGIRRADRFGASPVAMPQTPGSVYYHEPRVMDEDCLTVNVWAGNVTPRKRPVMVWIYGGAFVAGTSDYPLYDGEAMAAQDVVFVSFNYRLGVLGFFSHPELDAESPDGLSGNYALMDQIAALRWVQDNIAAFGGDPDNVTILGQSAGAFSVAFHLVMPASRGLFHRAIAQSGAPMGAPSSNILLGERAEMRAAGERFAHQVGAADLAALRAMPAQALVKAYDGQWLFYAQIDGHMIPDHPFTLISTGAHAQVPVMVGRNRDEGTMFPPLGGGTVAGLHAAIDDAYGAQAPTARRLFAAADDAEARVQGQHAFGDIVFNWNAAALAGGLVQSRHAPVYAYQFDYVGAVPPDARFGEGTGRELGAFHGSEIGFVLRTQAARHGPLTAEHHRLMERMSGWWLAFARTGDPNGGNRPHWPAYAPHTPSVLFIDGAGAVARALADRPRLETLGRAMHNAIIERI